MDDESEVSQYWCHACSQVVSPILEVETVKCPLCQDGFVEEMVTATAPEDETPLGLGATDSDRALSLWAPILLGMMSNPRRRRRFRGLGFGDDDVDDEDDEDIESNNHHHEDTERGTELESIIRRRRRSSATILQLLQGIRAGMSTEPENFGNDNGERGRENMDGERVILINPFNQTIIVQGSYDSHNNPQNQPTGSLSDYFIGPGLDLLLQHLAENDPNRYGTPPAQKEAVEALPTVKIEETLQCSVCLEDFEIGTEAKEMPCKHKFHHGCILPWLELHSSCPVCRYQLPSVEYKADSNGSRISSNNNVGSNNGNGSRSGEGDGRNENGTRLSLPIPWPLSSLFSSPVSQMTRNGNASSLMSYSPEPSTNTHEHPSASETNDD